MALGLVEQIAQAMAEQQRLDLDQPDVVALHRAACIVLATVSSRWVASSLGRTAPHHGGQGGAQPVA